MTWYKMTKPKTIVLADADPCPICGSIMIKRKGAYGEFYGCSKYPQCKGTRKMDAVPVQPQNPMGQPQQRPNPVVPIARENKIWHLATLLRDGSPVVVTKGVGGWEYQNEAGEGGVFPLAGIAQVIKSVEDAAGQKISGNDPKALFKKFREVQGKGAANEAKEDGANGGKIKGRIPEDKISNYQKAIELSFNDTKSNIMINALAGTGKAQPLDAKLLTPDGWISMGDVQVRDLVFGSDGLPHEVTGVFPQGEKEVFEVEMSDGSRTECCEEHLWLTETKLDRDLDRYHKEDLFSRAKVRKLGDLKNDLLYRGYPKHYIPIANPLEFNYQETGIDPYVMGVLLGDGSFKTGCVSFSSKDPEIIKYIENSLPERLSCNPTGCGCDYRISGKVKGVHNPIIAEIKKLNLWMIPSDKKFIPDVYKFNTIETRISILQGLLDTDGYISERTAEYCTTSYQLAKDVSFLVQSLGGTAKTTTRTTSYTYLGIKKKGKLSYRIYIKLPKNINPFRLERKLSKYSSSTKYHAKRSITNIKSVGKKECQCISIDSKDNLYITDDCILTHNTTVLKHIASFMKPGEQWLYIVFNKKNQLESQGKFPPGVTVMTSHGFLGQVLRDNGENYQTLPNTKYIFQEKINGVKPNEKKIDLIMDDVMSENGQVQIPQNLRYSASFIVKNIVSLCKAYSINPYSADKYEKVLGIIKSYNINTKIVDPDKQGKGWGGEVIELPDYTNELAEATLQVLEYSIPGKCNRPELNYVRDFDDTLWFSAINPNVVWPQYDVVLADEVQDFNECQSIMLRKLSEAGARVVAVGDPNQSIYRFRGSDSKSFEKVSQSIQAAPNGGLVHELPTNYRSGKNIIEYVRNNTHVKELQAGLNFDGNVTEGREKDEAIASVIDEMKINKKLIGSTAIIGRTNAPLAKTAIELMKNNIDFLIIGKDFSKELTDFIYKTTKKSKRNKFDANYLTNIPIQNLTKVIDRFTSEFERANERIPSKATEIKENNEMADLMTEVVGFLANDGYQDKKTNTRVNNAQDFIHYLKNKFSGINEEDEDPLAGKDPLSFVTLTSAHKSKGLEFDRVFIIEPNLFPHPKAKSEEDLAQEENAKYVAFTRAMKELHVLKPSDDKKKQRAAIASSSKKTKKASRGGWYKKAKTAKAKIK